MDLWGARFDLNGRQHFCKRGRRFLGPGICVDSLIYKTTLNVDPSYNWERLRALFKDEDTGLVCGNRKTLITV